MKVEVERLGDNNKKPIIQGGLIGGFAGFMFTLTFGFLITKGEILNLESLESLGIICLLPTVIFIGLGWVIGNYIQERKFVKAGIWCGIVFGFIQPWLAMSIEPLSAFYESFLGSKVSRGDFAEFLLWPFVCLIYPAIGAFIGYAFSRMKEGDDK